MTNPYEEALASGKYTHVIGADEVGYGAWAGPVLVCAAAVPVDWTSPRGLNDSKKVRPVRREEIFDLHSDRVTHIFKGAEAKVIDRDGISNALANCFRAALFAMTAKFPKALVVLDGLVKIPDVNHINFPKADGLVPAVMIASVFGKVARDRYMVKLAKKYPGYGLAESKGYGTKQHQEALSRLGPCPHHRRSYLPVGGLREPDGSLVEDPGICIE